MNIYGYKDADSDLISLEEITLQLSLQDMHNLMSFFENTLNKMEKYKEDFGHEHFKDFSGSYHGSDIIIST